MLAQYTEDPRFHSLPYSRHPVVVFVHRAHKFARRRAIRVAELDGEGMILREQGSTTRKAFDDALRKAGVTPRVVMEIGSREAIREAVIKGVGIGAVSEVEYIPHPDIRPVPLADASVHTYAHVVCLQERCEARLVRAFLDIARALRETHARAPSSRRPRRARR